MFFAVERNEQTDRQRDRDRQTDLFIVSVDGPEISNGQLRVDVFFTVERNERSLYKHNNRYRYIYLLTYILPSYLHGPSVDLITCRSQLHHLFVQ